MGDSGGRARLILKIEEGAAPIVAKRPRLSDDNTNNGVNNVDGQNSAGFLSPTELLRKMFESGTGDWKMISSDGEAYQFHQLVLSEQVPRFREMFSQNGTVEVDKKEIEIPVGMEVSGAAVDAFLRFVYYQDTSNMESSLEITCALIRMAHYYTIPKIFEAAQEIIDRKVENLNWFCGEDLAKLYREAWFWEDFHPYKSKLLETLVRVIKKLSNDNQHSEQILSLTNGDQVLKDLIVKLAHEPPPPPPPPPVPASPTTPPLAPSEVVSRYLSQSAHINRQRLERLRLLMQRHNRE